MSSGSGGAKWASRLGEFDRRNTEGQRMGLLAAAQVLSAAVKKRLSRGYTSGRFVTGRSVDAVQISDIFQLGRSWGIRVGTNFKSNLEWEVGHFNLFLKRIVRVERWRPAMMDSREAMSKAFARVYIRTMGDG